MPQNLVFQKTIDARRLMKPLVGLRVGPVWQRAAASADSLLVSSHVATMGTLYVYLC